MRRVGRRLPLADLTQSLRKESNPRMLIEATWSLHMPEPLMVCPSCAAGPFRSFMRGQVVRSAFLDRAPPFAVICSACKQLVAYEHIPPWKGEDRTRRATPVSGQHYKSPTV
jgi:hypothetical protein